MASDRPGAPVDQKEKVVDHCPICGGSASPLIATENSKRRRVVIECDDHGEFEVEFSV